MTPFNESDAVIKIADLGLARQLKIGSFAKSFTGTPQ
jgi:serine/threonine protein kinase